MPRGDWTGPHTGLVTGKGRGMRRGQQGGVVPNTGICGECICPSCGTVVTHKVGFPCYQMVCPTCGKSMVKNR